MKKISYGILILCTLAFNVWAFGELSFDKQLSIQGNRAKEIFIDVGAGNLNVSSGDIDDITVNARVYSKNYRSIDDLTDAFEDKMIFSLDRNGSTIVLKAMNRKSLFGYSNAEISIDLDIVIPRKMSVEIDDGSGDMWVRDIGGTLEIDDGSGSTFIDNIGGKVSIDDGSGNLTINNVRGSVIIDDGSGKITMNNIDGDVTIDDGSGGVTIVQVTGDVRVDDSSGSINVQEMVGHFKLIDDGSGSVVINGKKWHDD